MLALIANANGSPETAVIVCFGLPVAWFVGLFLFSRVGGWHRLARRYPASANRPQGITCVSSTVQMGGIMGPTYSRMMNITLSSSGVYIRPKLSYRLFHPPVLLPWRCVQSATERQFLLFRWLEVRCAADGSACKLQLPRSAAPILRAEMAASERRG